MAVSVLNRRQISNAAAACAGHGMNNPGQHREFSRILSGAADAELRAHELEKRVLKGRPEPRADIKELSRQIESIKAGSLRIDVAIGTNTRCLPQLAPSAPV